MNLFTLSLLFVVISSASAQQTPEIQVDHGKLFTFGQLLQLHHVELTEPSLLRALKHPDATVRGLAAMKLAEDKAADAIPAVKQALVVEKTPRARVDIAVALGLLGDSGGRNELRKACADESFPSEFRLYAVRYMFDLGVEKDKDCLRAAEEIAQIVDADYHTTGYRVSALELLPRFRNMTADESKTIFQLMVDRLDDLELTVRMEAGQSLATLGNTAAIPYLESAIAGEQEGSVRSALELDLQTLQTKQ